MKKLLVLLVLLGILTGCSTITKVDYYENGEMKSYYKKEGFNQWSDGDGKVINMPLANPSINGIGK